MISIVFVAMVIFAVLYWLFNLVVDGYERIQDVKRKKTKE